ncbi:MAG TPA: STAS domain-containing protein [Treponemataceae bacterium]|nr:STAS domain-containing protein [Treponemataceae bacterium]
MNVTFQTLDKILVCAVSGEVDLYAAPELHGNYTAMAAKEPSLAFVCDLSGATYMDSSGIGVLFQIYSDTRHRKVPFRVCGVTGMVKQLFALSKMGAILPVTGTRQEAIDSIRSST